MDQAKIINQVMDQIRRTPVRRGLESIANYAGYSPFHFHRQFKMYTGETYQNFSSRHRLTMAARQLRANRFNSILDLALHCGFNSAEDFSRRFRKQYGCTARDVQKGEFVSVNHDYKRKNRIRFLQNNSALPFIRELSVQALGPFDIVYSRVFHAMDGTPDVKSAIAKIYAWAIKNQQINFATPVQMLGMCWDDMDFTPFAKFIYDAGIVIQSNRNLQLESSMNHIHVPAMKYIVMDFEGNLADEADAFAYLWHSWIPHNRCLPALSPTLEIFQNENSLHDWNKMTLKLAVPITDSLF